MTYEGIITEISKDGLAQVCLIGEDCSGGCAGCSGCSKANAKRMVPAIANPNNTIGERVEISAPNGKVALIGFFVFCLPIMLAAGGYALFMELAHSRAIGAVAALVGAAIGVLGCVILNRKITKNSPTVYKIVDTNHNEHA